MHLSAAAEPTERQELRAKVRIRPGSPVATARRAASVLWAAGVAKAAQAANRQPTLGESAVGTAARAAWAAWAASAPMAGWAGKVAWAARGLPPLRLDRTPVMPAVGVM